MEPNRAPDFRTRAEKLRDLADLPGSATEAERELARKRAREEEGKETRPHAARQTCWADVADDTEEQLRDNLRRYKSPRRTGDATPAERYEASKGALHTDAVEERVEGLKVAGYYRHLGWFSERDAPSLPKKCTK